MLSVRHSGRRTAGYLKVHRIRERCIFRQFFALLNLVDRNSKGHSVQIGRRRPLGRSPASLVSLLAATRIVRLVIEYSENRPASVPIDI